MNEFSKRCDKCRVTEESHMFPSTVEGEWQYLCMSCWEQQIQAMSHPLCSICHKPLIWRKGFGHWFPYDLVQGELRRHHCEPIDGARDPITEKRLEKAKVEKKARGRTEWKEAV